MPSPDFTPPAARTAHSTSPKKRDIYTPILDSLKSSRGPGQSGWDLLAQSSPGHHAYRVQDGEAGIGGDDIRVFLLNIVLAAGGGAPMIAVLNAFGLAVTALAIGLRGSTTLMAGVGGGGGVDYMYFVDIANWRLTNDVFLWGEVGIGIAEGADGAVIVAYRVSPHGQYGQAHQSYAGPAWNASAAMLGTLGFSLSPGVLCGEEGWMAISIGIGKKEELSLSASWAVSKTDTVDAIKGTADAAIQSLRELEQQARVFGQFLDFLMANVIKAVLPFLFPDDWNLSGFLPNEVKAIRRFGRYMNEVIFAQGSLQDFFRTESAVPPPSISSRIQMHSTWDVPTMLAVAYALNAKYRRMEGDDMPDVWSLTDFNTTSYCNFLLYCIDMELFTL